MPDTSTNNELLTKILERLDQLDKKFIGEIQSVRGEVQAVGKRVDQLDEKFTGEIQSVRGEIQAARKESRDGARRSDPSFPTLCVEIDPFDRDDLAAVLDHVVDRTRLYFSWPINKVQVDFGHGGGGWRASPGASSRYSGASGVA